MLPVIIAGAGPTGLALALALAGHDVPTLVLDGAGGPSQRRLARTCVLPPDVARWARLPDEPPDAVPWTAWHTRYRGTTVTRQEFPVRAAPVQLPLHALEQALREAAKGNSLVRFASGCRLTDVEQHDRHVVAHTVTDTSGSAAITGSTRPAYGAGPRGWRGSYLVGCDGARSTVRKLLGVGFPGRTDVERYAVAALRTDLPWPGEAGLHRGLPCGEVVVRPLPADRWRLDWPLPADTGLVTPEHLLDLLHATLAAWHDGAVPPYDLLDTGVHICHQRLARRWRSGRTFLAGDAAHLLGALGTQQVAEGLRDVDNLAWKLGLACRHGAPDALLDSYEAERRPAVGARLRAVDQALPLVRSRGGIAARMSGRTRGRIALLTDAHRGRGTLGAPPDYPHSPLARVSPRSTTTSTPPGALVADVPVTALDGRGGWLWERLGGPLLLMLTAPGARVWDARHWLSAGLMPELAAAADALPLPTELLVTEEYPGAAAHTLLVVRPDGHLAAALPGTDHAELRACVDRLSGTAQDSAAAAQPAGTPHTARRELPGADHAGPGTG